MSDLRFRTTYEEDPDIYRLIKIGLEASNQEAASATRVPINVYVYDKETLVGGAVGYTVEATLIIKYLWVDRAFRSRGLARYLMTELENQSQGRGCKISFVDTMGYQAPDFYKKIGYNEVARVPEFHMDHDRIFLRKELT